MCPDPPDSLRALLERYERPLVRYAMSILGDLEAARDVVQETFIRWCRAGDCEKPEVREEGEKSEVRSQKSEQDAGEDGAGRKEGKHLEAWLFTVCRNRAIDFQRKRSRIIYLSETMDSTDSEPGPRAVLEQKEEGETIFALLDQLSANQREVIRLKFQNDLSYKEIAEITELSVTNVGFLLHTGLKKLRALLAEQPRDAWTPSLRSAL